MDVMAGVHEQYQGKVDRTTPQETLERYPQVSVTREFAANPIKPQNLVPKLRALCEPIWAQSLVPAVSFKLSVTEVLNGQWKPFVQSAAAWLKDNGHDIDTIFIIWHEPENDIAKHFSGAEQFVSYFNKVHDWLKSSAPLLLTCHAALGYRYADKNMGTVDNPRYVPVDIDDTRAMAWGKTNADIKSIDIYSGRSFPLTTILPELSGFKRWVTHTVGSTASYGVTERGWMADTAQENVARAATIRREADWLRSDPVGRRCKLYIIWLTVGAENDPTLKPDRLMMDAVNYLLANVNVPNPEPQQAEPEPISDSITCPLCNGSAKVPSGSYTIVKAV